MASLLSWQIEGGDSVKAGLAAIQNAIADLSPFWKEVFAPKYFGMVQDLFATSGTPRGEGGKFAGPPWQRLSPAYALWKSKHFPGKPILTRTGDLRESLRWGGSGLGPGGIFQATPSFVVAGTAIPYGKYHQTGTSRMPARPFLPPPDPTVFAPLMLKWIMKAHAQAAK
jgi:phage gpG-like protein